MKDVLRSLGEGRTCFFAVSYVRQAKNMKKILAFLKKQKLLALACHNKNNIWLANVYFAVDAKGTMYFVSPMDSLHSKLILKNPNIAFSTAWFDPSNHQNRKGVQGRGVCRVAKNIKEITTGVTLIARAFPDLRTIITAKWIKDNAWGTKVWMIKPSYIKYWDDELFGDDESKEFTIT